MIQDADNKPQGGAMIRKCFYRTIPPPGRESPSLDPASHKDSAAPSPWRAALLRGCAQRRMKDSRPLFLDRDFCCRSLRDSKETFQKSSTCRIDADHKRGS